MKYLTVFTISKNGIPSGDQSALVFDSRDAARNYVHRFKHQMAGYISDVIENASSDHWQFYMRDNTMIDLSIVHYPKGDVRFDVSYSVGGNEGLRRRYSTLELAKEHVGDLIRTFSDADMDYYDDDGEWSVITRNRRTLLVTINIVILGGRDAVTHSEYEKACSVLGVKPGVTEDEAKTVFRQLSKIYHPDMPNGSAEKFKEIKSAYEYVVNNEPEVTRSSGPRRIVREYSYLDIMQVFLNAESRPITKTRVFRDKTKTNVDPLANMGKMAIGMVITYLGLVLCNVSSLFILLAGYGIYLICKSISEENNRR